MQYKDFAEAARLKSQLDQLDLMKLAVRNNCYVLSISGIEMDKGFTKALAYEALKELELREILVRKDLTAIGVNFE